ncbi:MULTISPECIES: hypothetical protein [unclassified Flavobacterium]|uniref:hypothetical protein n=1 Tax=unclassified Flavobacterium TaxID=196869 RepID=UPI0025B92F7B|nr:MULTISPECIES: hypothetical protein [unclassified Flavobacterium]
MRKLGVVITDGVGFRNFILSDFLNESEKKFDEVVILSCLPKEAYLEYNHSAKVVELDVFEERFATWFFRKLKESAHLRLHRADNFGIDDNYRINQSKANNPRGFATRLIYHLVSVCHSEKWIRRFDAFQQATFKNHKLTRQYRRILRDEKLNIIFFTHQRPPFIAPLVYAARKQHIKTATFIFSWDNLASKGRMAADFDYFLVWSELMKRDLLQFYSTVKNGQIAVVGTPQFEPYVLSRYEITKNEFLQKFKLQISLKTLCYSCGDSSTSKNDELYISIIAKAVLENRINNINFIVRTSPAESPERFFAIAAEFPFIKWNYPKWVLLRQNHQEAWSQRVPQTDDVIELRALAQHSDLNVNMLSTMTLDFMIFDKPVIFPVFGNINNALYNDGRFLEFKHIKHVLASDAATVALNETELIDAINHMLENPCEKLTQQRQLVALEMVEPLAEVSTRFADVLFKFSLDRKFSSK